mmetsp:Transcript_9785/g.16475  ORF Transcript_9785/g.16475 Transcript_9785/m.16475 type:complete len:87 (+) Transcript_9785:378-638(+)
MVSSDQIKAAINEQMNSLPKSEDEEESESENEEKAEVSETANPKDKKRKCKGMKKEKKKLEDRNKSGIPKHVFKKLLKKEMEKQCQ